jgi:16S rRNA C1402 (ribose-2'-O) methylase RsmI
MCQSSSVTPTLAHQGVVAEETTVRRTIGAQLDHPVRVGSVHAVGGAVLIARLEGEVRPGDDVALWSDRGAPVARRVPRRSSST